MTFGTTPSQPDARAEALVGAYERAGYRRVAPPILQPAEPFLDLSGEDIRKRMYLTTDAGRPRTVPAAGPHHSGVARLSRLASRRHGRRAFAISARSSATAARCRRRFVQAGIESFGRAGQGGGRRRDAGARARGDRALRHCRSRKSAWAMSALFAALVAALDLAPAWKRRLVKDFNRKSIARARSRTADARRARTSGRNIRACWLRWPAPIRRPRTRWSPTCFRSPASTPSAAARSARSPSAFSSRRRSARPPRCRGDDAALIEQFLAIAGDPDEAAAELRALAARRGLRHRAGARPVREPHRLSRRARRRCRAHPLLDRVRPRPRLLHRLRVRAARPGDSAERAAGRRRPLRRPADAGSARTRRSPRSASRSGSSGSPTAEARHERAARHRRAGQGPVAGERRGVLRPRRPAAGQAARRARLSRRDRRARRRRGRVSVGVRDHRAAGAGHGASRRHRRGSGARDDRRRGQARRADRRPRLRLRQCRGRGAAGLDRRAQHGRSRRCRDRVPAAPRPQDAGRDQIREPDARLLRARTASSITASSKAPARPKARPRPAPPN